MRKLLLPIVFALGSVPVVGVFTLDRSVASSASIFVVLILTYLAGWFWSVRIASSWRIFLLTAAGLIFYAASALILHPIRSWHLPPLFCLVGFSFGFWVRRNRYFALALWGVFTAYYGFVGYPQWDMTYSKWPSTTRMETDVVSLAQIRLLDSMGRDRMGELSGSLTLLETWNQSCGACFQAMRDLHPFFEKMEESHPSFSHYYVYTGARIPDGDTLSVVFRNARLPYEDQQVLLDPDRQLLDLPESTGLPQFNFMDSSRNLVHLSEGYRANFSHAYKRRFQALVERHAR